MRRPTIVAVAGFTSNVGKTTLMCHLITAFPEWEAIKTTRGHYRSCGKDPHACCVSHLLSDEPVIRSGRDQTYAPGKDTGRYWDAGARNVHWVIAAEDQVEKGIKQAVDCVRSQGVFIEGNSFTEFVNVDYMVMVARTADLRIKGSARRALRRASALYVWDECKSPEGRTSLNKWLDSPELRTILADIPIYGPESLSQLVAQMRGVDSAEGNAADSYLTSHLC